MFTFVRPKFFIPLLNVVLTYFDFSKLTLANPNGLQGGAYFTKLKMNNEPLYMQMPRSLTKQGIVKTEKKIYCDLLFSNEDTNVIEWLSNLEERVQEIIYEKRNLWFQQELELDDIQTAFNSSLRTPPCIFSALIVATITTQSGFRSDFLHLILINFSAPKSAPNPA